MISGRHSQRGFFVVCALLFAGTAAMTAVWCASMSTMGEMPMPGGWRMSMAWMRMSDQTWSGAGASFLGMWITMMAAMMLPSLAPLLNRYRQAVRGTDEKRIDRMTALVIAGYFLTWTMVGTAAFGVGAALATIEMRYPALAQAVPVLVGFVVLIGGAFQFTAWKAYHLSCCRNLPGRSRMSPAETAAAWQYGLRLGLHCNCCFAGLTAILLVVGVMDLRMMAIVTTAITTERLAPNSVLVTRVIGILVSAAGLFLVMQAALT
jgi:predicted metal-binding membrane protein